MHYCARAPVRVDPGGGGTDCPPFSVEHGGLVVNIGVARYVYAAFEKLPASQGITIVSRDRDEEVRAQSASALLPCQGLALLQALVKRLVPRGDCCRLVTDSDVPEGAGLGGSAALGVAVTAAIDRAYGRKRSAAEIAEEADDVERRDLGAPGGNQDSYGAAMGCVNLLEYVKGGGTRHRKIKVPEDAVLRLERDSLLIYTGEGHVSGSIHDDIKRSYGQPNSPTLKAMFGLRDEAAVMAKALEAGDIEGYARAMNKCRFHHYGLHESCDSETLRRYFTALEKMILGGKTCGAGGGGFILVCAKPEKRRDCVRAAEELGGLVWPFAIAREGVQTWTEESSDHG